MPFMKLMASFVCILMIAAGQGQPDYTNKADILNGRRTILQVDDIGILAERQRDGNYRDMALNVYNSTNLVFGQPAQPGWGNTSVAQGLLSRPVFGRWWESPTDRPALVFHADQDPILLTLDRPANAPGTNVPNGSAASVPCLAKGDFTNDGYTDLVIATYPPAGIGNPGIVLASASDTTQVSAPKFGPNLLVLPCLSMTAGDFNGDGQLELAHAGSLPDGTVQITIYTVDPKTMSFTQVSTLVVTGSGVSQTAPITKVSLTAGKFTNDARQQLAIAYAQDSSQITIKTIAVQDLQMKEGDTFPTGNTAGSDGTIGLEAAKLFSSQPTDALVYFYAQKGPERPKTLSTLSVDPVTLKLTLNHPGYGFGIYDCGYGFAVGNFDYRIQDPANPNQTELSLDRQIAFIGGSCNSPTTLNVEIVVLADGFKPVGYKTSTIPVPQANMTDFTIIHGDFQGRSMILGAPNKIELNQNIQTSVVVAAPPSHVDFITPATGGNPKVLNISALPEGFKTSYNTTTKSQNQSSNTSGTSWGASASITVNETASFGDLSEGDGFEEKSSLTAAQKMKGESDQENTSYSGVEYDVSSSSGAGDNFWYSGSRLNIWVYPVIGKKVCPKNKQACLEADKVPMVIMYSGPDQIENTSTSQQVSSLYQPPWEYGNLLSYPVNLAQLKTIMPGIHLLTSESEPSFSVSGGPLAINTNWTAGGSTGTKSSFTQNYSFDASTSVQGAVGIPGIFSVGGGVKVDVSGSAGFSSQTTNQQSLDTSTGLAINKPGGFLDASLYGYTATPYIFGRTPPGNVLDTSKTPPPAAGVASFGALRSAFTADIVSSSAGGFWRQAYGGAPDIGLSHPARWAFSSDELQDPVPPNCRPSGANNSQQDCFDVHLHLPNNPWLSPSLFMQGFFVTNASNGPVDPRQMQVGPNLTFANAGTKLTLQARVYNFSFKPMPVNSTVHVQFYGMPWNTDTNTPAGAPFKIGPANPTGSQDVILGAIPPLDNGNALNWAYAEVDFDTTARDDQYLVFWVLVWAETGSGSSRTLVPEIAGHGLSALPDDVITDMSKVPVEMNPSVNNQNGMVTYSNNLGFYRSVIYIAPSTSEFRAHAATADRTKLRLQPVAISQSIIIPNQSIEISTMIQPQGTPAHGATVQFYDGHPDEGGTMIRAEHVTWIRADKAYQIRIPYMPRKPGLRRIWAFLNKGTPYESVRASEILCVGKSCLADIVPASAMNRIRERTLDPREKP